ncbi:hypothetical protein C3E97_013365 [Pseudomonas sp. MWU12-2115]|nr:hypothetical protein C3E97_013365 [Pseudomonas sp. MWU12-2115]
MAGLGKRNDEFTVSADALALQPQFHGISLHHCPMHTHRPCGSGLAREGVVSGTKVSTDTPHSRASPLPQGGR